MALAHGCQGTSSILAKMGAVMPMVGNHTPFSVGVAPINTTRPVAPRGAGLAGPA
jgi:hypothetical protein